MGKRQVILTMVLMALMLLMSGCKDKSQEVMATETSPAPVIVIETTEAETQTRETETETETEAEETEEEPEERVEVDGKIKSYLTGEMVEVEKANRRPLAVMMSNDREALPQYGINRAGVVYEAPVEGGMNRYMAILEDYDDLDRIGSVRSCRTYYTFFAREFDAIYAHFGQSTFARPYLDNVDNINGIEGVGSSAFYRSSDRHAPHNAYTSFEKIQKAVEQAGYSQEYSPDYNGHYRFARNGKQIYPENSMDAYRVVPGYAIGQPYFLYSEEDGLYHRYQYGDVHYGSEGPIAVKNLIIQYCSAGHYATTEYLNIDVHTSQYGYYMTNGRAIPLSWKKDGQFGVTHYYNVDNEEITLNQGKTWVCIVPTGDFGKTEIYGKDD